MRFVFRCAGAVAARAAAGGERDARETEAEEARPALDHGVTSLQCALSPWHLDL